MVGMEQVMQKKNRHSAVAVFFWSIFLILTGAVVYLSFQNGADARDFGRELIEYIARLKYDGRELSVKEMDAFTYVVRQTGRVAAFFMMGILGTICIHLTCRKCDWTLKTGIAVLFLVGTAYLTEKLKVYIPSRHYNYEEMMLSISAVTLGFSLVSLVTFIIQALKSSSHLRETAH